MEDDDKLTLDYYLSIPVNPFTEDNTITQEEVIERGELQFKLDSILNTIGTPECKYNIDEFWFEVFDEMQDDDQVRNFLFEIWNKLLNTYSLETLRDNNDAQTFPLTMRREIYQMLEFFEKGTCTKVIARFFSPDDISVFTSGRDRLLQHLLLHYNVSIKELKRIENHLPETVYYALTMMAKKDFVKLIYKLIDSNLNAVIADVLSLKRG